VTPCTCGYTPVRKETRDGEQREEATKAFSKRTPSRARRSIAGVLIG
jgi:hypothetical protein